MTDIVLTPLRDSIDRCHTAKGLLALSRLDQDFTVRQAAALLVLRAAPAPPTMGDMARAMDLSPSTLSRIMTKLQHMRLVTRASNPKDRRECYLTLTDAGAEAALGLYVPG